VGLFNRSAGVRVTVTPAVVRPRQPAQGGALDGPPLNLGKKIPMQGGYEFGLPFSLPLPADAAPTTTAVHSSLSWFVGARVFYSGFTSHQIERVRRPIVVVNAP
jgi:hypothetical protein